MYFNDDKKKSFPRICGMGNPKAANKMIVTLAAGYLAGGCTESPEQAVKKAAEAVEMMLRVITGEDERPSAACATCGNEYVECDCPKETDS